jgi:hypothetical protein
MVMLNEVHYELKTSAKKGKLIIFAGAGISKTVHLPLWNELITTIIAYIINDNKKQGEILEAMFDKSDSINKIFDILTYIERNELQRHVNSVLAKEIFQKSEEIIRSKRSLPIHSKLWQLSKKIITPNYDTLFESCKDIDTRVISNQNLMDLSQINSYENYLLKIHGNISELDNIIFYESQYYKQYNKETGITNRLKELISNHTVLFIGTSMKDPFINNIIEQVSTSFQFTNSQNYILSIEDLRNPNLVKIHGDPIKDLEPLIDELISETKERLPAINPIQFPKRIKLLKDAIDHLHSSNSLFPCFEDFNNIILNEQIFDHVKNRFKQKAGPILFEGRWSTGKTVSALKIALELNNHGFNSYFLDFVDDIAGQEDNIINDYLHKILEKYNNDRVVFILDNSHFFPEHTYKICQWAINKKANCLFIGRPISKEFRETRYYYPQLFQNSYLEDVEEISAEELPTNEILSKKILFKPDIIYIKSIITNRLNLIGKTVLLNDHDIEKFSKSVSYNLSLIAFHLTNIKLDTKNIYEINYGALYDFLNNKYLLSEFSEELFIIASLAYLDCKTDCNALFTSQEKKMYFIHKQEHLEDRRNFIYGMHSATGKLILDVGIERGLIRTPDNSICYDLDIALKYLLEKHLMNKPFNVYEIFLGLSNLEYEFEEASDRKSWDSTKEIIYHLLNQPELHSHYIEIIINKTNSLLKFGFFIRLFLHHKIELLVIKEILSIETIIKLCYNFIEFRKKRTGLFRVNWHIKYVWTILRKVDITLAGLFLNQFSNDSLINYASASIVTFSRILEMALYHSFIEDLIIKSKDHIIGTKQDFQNKFTKTNELKIFFFLRNLDKLSKGDFKSKILMEITKSYITPTEYANFVLSLNKITILSFRTARNFLGRNYFNALLNEFDPEFIYSLCYDMPLQYINIILSEIQWKKFLKTDLYKKFKVSEIEQISTFIRNISLHGTSENNILELTKKLNEEKIITLLMEKLTSTKIDEVFNFFWQLKTLNEKLFNTYFDTYYSIVDIDISTIEESRVAFGLFFLTYFYSTEINSQEFLDFNFINLKLKKIILNNSFTDKVYISSFNEFSGSPVPIPYDHNLEKIKAFHFFEPVLEILDNERNRFDVYNSVTNWWESKIILFSTTLIAINRIDSKILKYGKFTSSLKRIKLDVEFTIGKLENRIPQHGDKTLIEYQLYRNRLSILNKANIILEQLSHNN